jgi:hypothetical protein
VQLRARAVVALLWAPPISFRQSTAFRGTRESTDAPCRDRARRGGLRAAPFQSGSGITMVVMALLALLMPCAQMRHSPAQSR